MNQNIFRFMLCGMLLAFCLPAEAQQTGKIFRIGYLDASTASGSAVHIDAFRQEMRKLGWIEGKNITIEYRFGEQKNERLPELAADLVHLRVDLIVVVGTPASLAAKSNRDHPHRDGERSGPCSSGLVASLAQPGGNVTGLSSLSPELNTKRLEILNDAVPKLVRVGLLWLSGRGMGQDLQRKELRPAAPALKLKLEEIETQPDAEGLESAFQTAKQKQVNAIMTTTGLPFSLKESGSSSLPPNTGCLLFTHRRSLSLRAVSLPMGWMLLSSADARRVMWTNPQRRQTG